MRVKAGDVIVYSGNSGRSQSGDPFGPHLHFIIGKSRLSAISIPMGRLYMKREGGSSFKYYDATKGELNSSHPGHIKGKRFTSSNQMRERASVTITDCSSRYEPSSGALTFDNLSFINNHKAMISDSSIMNQQSVSVSLRVYDTSGRGTGLVVGEVKEEISGPEYNSITQTVSFPPPYSNYCFEVHGNSQGTMI